MAQVVIKFKFRFKCAYNYPDYESGNVATLRELGVGERRGRVREGGRERR